VISVPQLFFPPQVEKFYLGRLFKGRQSQPSVSSPSPVEALLYPPPGQRCKGRNYGDRRCCTPETPCGLGEGDCDGPGDGGQNDGDAGCQGDLVCGSNNCRKFGLYYHEKDDCCEKASDVGSRDKNNPSPGQVIPGVPLTPKPGQRCAGRNFGQRRCCSPSQPCDEGEGDCDGQEDGGQHDGNAGCKGDLVCGSNNCKQFGSYYHEKDDCCERPRRNLPLMMEPETIVTLNQPSTSGSVIGPRNPSVPVVCSSPLCLGSRCQGRNVDQGRCCTASNPCEEGEGDCDNSNECRGGLVCGNNNCAQFGSVFHPKDDCCVRPRPEENSVNPGPRCQGRNVDTGRCCTAASPCVEGEGDCDNDQECGGDMVCGNNNCQQFSSIFHPKDDCCVKPPPPVEDFTNIVDLSPRCQGRNVDTGRCCTAASPCVEGEGDCDNDQECGGDMVCGDNNCKQFGEIFHPKDDCCVTPQGSQQQKTAPPVDLSIPFEPKLGQRCAGRNFGDRRCCTPENPCDEGEGDCDGPGDGGNNDGHRGCRGDLVCGSNNCKKFGHFYHEKDDCCEKPSAVQNAPVIQIPKGVWQEPPTGEKCSGRNYHGRRCCTPDNPCDIGEGDCDGPGDGGQHDGDAGCRGDLVCGSNNCLKFGAYFHPKDDCCENPDGSGGVQPAMILLCLLHVDSGIM